jgi:hypothetical protein
VQYVQAATPVIQGMQAVGNQIQFSFAALSGQPYTVQYKASLNPGSWLTLTNIPPQATATNVVVHDPSPSDTQRFYRVGVF